MGVPRSNACRVLSRFRLAWRNRVVLLSGWAMSFVAGPLWAEECKVLRITGSDQWVPFAFVDASHPDVPQGIAFDVARRVAVDLGIPAELSVGLPWSRLELAMKDGDIDMLAGNYWNEERAINWAVSIPFAQDEARVFVRQGEEFPYNSLKDLIGYSGVMPLGISLGQEFDAFKSQLNIRGVKLHTQMFRMLRAQRVDYMVLPYLSGMTKIKRLGMQDEIVPLPKSLNLNTVHLSLSRASPCVSLIDEVNVRLQKLLQDGSIAEIQQRSR